MKSWILLTIGLQIITTTLSTAQAVFTNAGQVLYIAPQATVTVNGDASNTGFIQNAGSFSVAGNWANQASYSGRGMFILNGKGSQTVQHSPPGGVVQIFGTLVLAGGGEKIWLGDAGVDSAFVLQSGILSPQPNSQLILRENVRISGGSNGSYVNGRLISQGTGDHFFPLGRNGHYKPITLQQITGTNPVVGLEVFPRSSGSAPELSHGVERVSPVWYWQQQTLSGTLETALVTLSFGADEQLQYLDSLIVAQAPTPEGPFQSLGQGQVQGSVSTGNITSQLPFTQTVLAIGIESSNERKIEDLVFVPNAFAPTATNAEEKVIKVYGPTIATEGLLFRIYNRWGRLVFESQSYETITQIGWDGRNIFNGFPESQGVYTYTLKGKFTGGHVFTKVGNIQLLP